jgi:glycosyltransferase involved in cell wall biosynthesis
MVADRRRRIALVTDAIRPFHQGGKEVRYDELARRLSAVADVTVYTMRWWGPGRHYTDGEVSYVGICRKMPLYSGGRRSIRQALVFAVASFSMIREPFDVLEADHMPYLYLFPLRLVAWARQTRFVVTWHECWGPDYWKQYLGRLGVIGWLFERTAMSLPDLIVAASPQTAERIDHLTGGSAAVISAPNGINLQLIHKAPAIPGFDLVVIGRLLPHKRVDLALDAIAALEQQGTVLSVLIIGTGPQESALRERALGLGLADRIEFRSDISSEAELFGYLKGSRVALFPSEREGFGIAVLEALASGVAVVTTSAPDNMARHLVEESAGGIVCEPSISGLTAGITSALKLGIGPHVADGAWFDRYDWQAVADTVWAELR